MSLKNKIETMAKLNNDLEISLLLNKMLGTKNKSISYQLETVPIINTPKQIFIKSENITKKFFIKDIPELLKKEIIKRYSN